MTGDPITLAGSICSLLFGAFFFWGFASLLSNAGDSSNGGCLDNVGVMIIAILFLATAPLAAGIQGLLFGVVNGTLEVILTLVLFVVWFIVTMKYEEYKDKKNATR